MGHLSAAVSSGARLAIACLVAAMALPADPAWSASSPKQAGHAAPPRADVPDLRALKVHDLEGRALSLVELGHGQATLIVFLRHFG